METHPLKFNLWNYKKYTGDEDDTSGHHENGMLLLTETGDTVYSFGYVRLKGSRETWPPSLSAVKMLPWKMTAHERWDYFSILKQKNRWSADENERIAALELAAF